MSDSRSGRALTHQQSENTERATHNREQQHQVARQPLIDGAISEPRISPGLPSILYYLYYLYYSTIGLLRILFCLLHDATETSRVSRAIKRQTRQQRGGAR
eukprot:COSAG06_NODE_48534_length_331_cov_0.896552_1_plen_100_part_10